MLDQMKRGSLGEPIGFWRFVIIATVVMTILRSIFFQTSLTGSSLFPFAIALYVVYRIARVQPSWPFRVPDGEGYKQTEVGPVGSENAGTKFKKPVTADHLKSLSNKFKSPKVKHPMDPNKYVAPLMANGDVRLSPKQFNDSLITNVGVRRKVVRIKTVRSKTVRQPRK
jgi:hypothetical protein